MVMKGNEENGDEIEARAARMVIHKGDNQAVCEARMAYVKRAREIWGIYRRAAMARHVTIDNEQFAWDEYGRADAEARAVLRAAVTGRSTT
jgi:hypothetical protein